ncbi:MAG: DUF2085 domain-containing protein [Melioribacteraceae bacterium]|nr:DUF2085 domain-containing protein [Melioribacteraceae bacterium]
MKSVKIKITEIILLFLITIWCIGIFWEFIAYKFPNLFYYLPFLKYNYSIICHTQSEKLLEIGMFKTLTCSRCTGIYLGGFVSALILFLGFRKSISTKTLLFSSIPMFIDVILYSFGIYHYSKYLALLTGLLLGSVGFIYIHNSIIELVDKQR